MTNSASNACGADGSIRRRPVGVSELLSSAVEPEQRPEKHRDPSRIGRHDHAPNIAA
jgi:hypothetical protein